MAELLEHPLVGEVRGAGMIGGIQSGRDASTLFDSEAGVGTHFSERCIHHGLLTRASGDCLALCPPLVSTQGEIDEIFDRIGLALQDTLEMAHRKKLV
jgi:4-aminobutyrate--pyruvate transaminase